MADDDKQMQPDLAVAAALLEVLLHQILKGADYVLLHRSPSKDGTLLFTNIDAEAVPQVLQHAINQMGRGAAKTFTRTIH